MTTALTTITRPVCVGCNRYADEIQEYIDWAADYMMPVDEYVKHYEGTYNFRNAHFASFKGP